MLKVVDVVYHCHNEFNKPEQVLEKHHRSLGFVQYIKDRVNYEVISHLNYEGKQFIDGVTYSFLKRGNEPWKIPFKTHRYIKSLKPDVILVHGFVFPLQVIALKLAVGKNCKIILHHHAEKPLPSVRIFFQKIADRYIDAYLFTSQKLGEPWLQQKVIRNENKCVEILGASTDMQKQDKEFCKQKLNVKGNCNFLSVGRLNENKDPLTVLKGFHQHALQNPEAKIYMIYQTTELKEEIIRFINENDLLKLNVHMIGIIPENKLSTWYSAMDIFISGSHSEGSGYALVEAMHCGCIPVVTNIPSFNAITGKGKYGFLYEPGNSEELAFALNNIPVNDFTNLSDKIHSYAQNNLSFKNIADQVFELCDKLVSVKR